MATKTRRSQPDDELVLALTGSDRENGQFSAKRFFQQWFSRRGAQYLFLFQKNLRVTNIQFAELRALVRTNLRDKNGATPESIQFLSVDEFIRSLELLVRDFPPRTDSAARYRKIAELYRPLLQRMVVMTPWFGTCELHLPAHLSIDLAAICAKAGYLHSCGRLVYARRIADAQPDELIDALDLHLAREKHDDRPKHRRFVVYCHEDYTDFDRPAASSLKYGLDELKIHLDKVFLGDSHLVDVVGSIKDRFRDLRVPLPGDYHRHDRTPDLTTIWLLRDHGLGNDLRSPADDSVLLCYEQDFCNRSPFQIFDENKPAWVAHTTMPHALAAAMINITRLGWPKGQVKVCDPFAGTGTTLLECLRDSQIDPEGSDLNNLVQFLVGDNLAVLAMNDRQLQTFATELCSVLRFSLAPDALSGDAALKDLQAVCPEQVVTLCDSLPDAGRDPVAEFDTSVVERAAKFSRAERVAFYLCLRARRRHSVALERGSETETAAFASEATRLLNELRELIRLRKSETDVLEGEARVTHVSRYSPGLTVDRAVLTRHEGRIESLVSCRDVKELPPGAYDVIVADPPYGFNTKGQIPDLAELFAKTAARLVAALKPNGQLVISLPQISKTGRRVPYFTQREIVTQQIIVAAETQNRSLVVAGFAAPHNPALFRPPFYWDSERALRRAILHFRFS